MPLSAGAEDGNPLCQSKGTLPSYPSIQGETFSRPLETPQQLKVRPGRSAAWLRSLYHETRERGLPPKDGRLKGIEKELILQSSIFSLRPISLQTTATKRL